MKESMIRKALTEIENAWREVQNVPISMTAEEFEKRLLKMAKKYGVTYSQKKGKWLDIAKKAISDSNMPQSKRNLYLAEVDPPEIKRATKKLHNALMKLHGAVEWAYEDVREFVNDNSKDELLRTFLRWRVLPVAEACHKLNKRGHISTEELLKLRPMISIRRIVQTPKS